jgi:hypothetical protein
MMLDPRIKKNTLNINLLQKYPDILTVLTMYKIGWIC